MIECGFSSRFDNLRDITFIPRFDLDSANRLARRVLSEALSASLDNSSRLSAAGIARFGGDSSRGRILRPHAPHPSLPVQVVVLQHPVAHEQRSVRREGDPDGSEILAAGDQRLRDRLEARPLLLEPEAVDAVVPPARHQQVAEVLLREGVVLVGQDAAGGLARAGDHRQRAGDFAVPTGEGVQPLRPLRKRKP